MSSPRSTLQQFVSHHIRSATQRYEKHLSMSLRVIVDRVVRTGLSSCAQPHLPKSYWVVAHNSRLEPTLLLSCCVARCATERHPLSLEIAWTSDRRGYAQVRCRRENWKSAMRQESVLPGAHFQSTSSSRLCGGRTGGAQWISKLHFVCTHVHRKTFSVLG